MSIYRRSVRRSAGKVGVAEPGDAVEFARERLGFEPDLWQEEVLRSTAKRGILLCSRQAGKSTVIALKAVWMSVMKPNSLVVVASNGERASGEFMLKAKEFVGRLGLRVHGDGVNRLSLVLPNGSRIVALPEVPDHVRGFSNTKLLIFDEAAQVKRQMFQVLRPFLAVSGGELWMMSTPFGRQGVFYETWHHGGEKWHRVKIQATECKRISREFLEEERRDMGDATFRQEYMCEFVETGKELFSRAKVEAAVDGEIKALRLK